MSGYWVSTIIPVLIDGIAVLGLYLIANCGRLSVGHATFFGVGAYAGAVAAKHFGAPFPVALVVGTVVAGLLGLLFAWLAEPLDHWFFAIATLAFGIMVSGMIANEDALGAATGYYGVPLAVGLSEALLVLAGVLAFVIWWDASPWGRAARAVRDSAVAAQAFGINPRRVHILTFALGAAVAGVAGVMWAHYLGVVRPSDMSFEKSLLYLVYLSIGGMEWGGGALLGTALLGLLPEVLRFSRESRFVLYGGLLALVMVLRPAGILPSLKRRPGTAGEAKD